MCRLRYQPAQFTIHGLTPSLRAATTGRAGSVAISSLAVVIPPVVIVLIVLGTVHERPVQTNDDELVRVGLARYPAVAERIVVVVKDPERGIAQRDHALDRLERKAEYGTLATDVVGVVNLQQVGDLVLDEKSVIVDLVEVHDVDFLERRGGALKVVALDDEKALIGDGGEVANRLPCRLEVIEPLPAGIPTPPQIELVDGQGAAGRGRSSAPLRAWDRASCRRD